uniref:Ankyrin repeat domain 50-like n=1 Tax=Sinocyclocheilus anshuiensis TaxID=1608454 RepID=A0A671NE87_9TELE
CILWWENETGTAAYMGHKEAVEILLNAGANLNLADGDGRTALSVAALCVPSAAGGRGHGEVVSLLLERGANPEHKDTDGMTPLLLASYEGHEEVVELLLEAGADVDEKGRSPLILAAQEGHCSTVRLLLDRKSPIDHRAYDGHSALSAAALQGYREIVELLMQSHNTLTSTSLQPIDPKAQKKRERHREHRGT